MPDDETDAVHLVDLVRKGYNALSYRYRSDDADDGRYAPWLESLHNRLPAGAAVLDLGCGCGVPVARSLAAAGHQVTGVDVSEVQVARARRLVPTAAFIRADATKIEFPAGSFDAVVCLYAMIHMPLAAQPALIGRIARWLGRAGLEIVEQSFVPEDDGGHALFWARRPAALARPSECLPGGTGR